MKLALLAIAALALALLFGCPGLPSSPPAANNTTVMCPDGTNATNASLCKKPEQQKFYCPDGTAVSDPKLCKPKPADASQEVQLRLEQASKVKNASNAIDLDRQLLLRGIFLYDKSSTEGCRDYYGYYQGMARKFEPDYAAYLDEMEKLSFMYAENETCKAAIASGKAGMGSTWQYAWKNAAIMLALCPEDEFHRDFYFYYQTNTSWENVTKFVGASLDGLDAGLNASCERSYAAAK